MSETEVRPHIDAVLVRKLVAAQFPRWAHLPVAPVAAGGVDNRTFRLGESMSVRLPSAEGYAPQAAKEQRWLPVLAPRLPLPVPAPLAGGEPAEGYPFRWTVNRWIEGETASAERIADLTEFATDLASFLVTLQRTDATGGPLAGAHSAFRGASLTTYDAETRRAVAALTGDGGREVRENGREEGREDERRAQEGRGVRLRRRIPPAVAATVTALWETALRSVHEGPPVWFHGDVAHGNLLVRDGRLCAVIDFGCSGVGDPACDLTVAWTLLSGGSRETFREAVYAGGRLDPGAWARARGWALWKALITLAWSDDDTHLAGASYVLDAVLAD